MSKTPSRMAAVLVVLSLVCAAVPASASPDGLWMSQRNLIQVLRDWLPSLWVSGGKTNPQPMHERLGPDLDPGGEPQSVAIERPVQGELGSDADPDG